MNSTTNSHHNVPKTQLHLEVICNGGYQRIENVVVSLKTKDKNNNEKIKLNCKVNILSI